MQQICIKNILQFSVSLSKKVGNPEFRSTGPLTGSMVDNYSGLHKNPTLAPAAVRHCQNK